LIHIYLKLAQKSDMRPIKSLI